MGTTRKITALGVAGVLALATALLVIGVNAVVATAAGQVDFGEVGENAFPVTLTAADRAALSFNPYTLRAEAFASPRRVGTRKVEVWDPMFKDLKGGPTPRMPRRPAFRSPARPPWP